MQKPTVRYFINGEYREATVTDVGDLEKLKTSIKTDLVSAINSLYSGEGDFQTKLDQFNKEVGNISDEVKNLDGKWIKENSILKDNLDKELEKAKKEMLELSNRLIEEANKKGEAYQKQVENIYNDYKESEKTIKTAVDSANREISATKSGLKEYQEKLSLMEIGVNEVSANVNKVDGKLEGYAKKTDFDLVEARVQEAESQIEFTAEGLKQKATKGELDSAIDRVAKFEGQLEATAKKLESKLTREEVINEINNERNYGANIIKGTRNWEDWKLTGKAARTGETYRNRGLIQVYSDSDTLTYDVDGLKIGETYTFSLSAMTKVEGVSVLLNGKEMKQQSNEDTVLGDGYHRLFINIVPKNNKEKFVINVKGLTNGLVNITSPKLEKGAKNTSWVQHADDIYEKTVKHESSIKQIAEQLDIQLKSIEKNDKDIKETNTRINATSEGLVKVSEKVESSAEKMTKAESEIKSLNDEMSSRVTSTELNSALDNLVIDGSNLIVNSAFEDGFKNWQTVAKGYSIDEFEETKYAKITRTGLKAVTIDALTSHYFEVDNHDKLNVSFDVYSDNPTLVDDKRIAYIELFNKTGERVARKEYTITELLGTMIAKKPARAKFTYIVDREDVVKAAITLALYKNGHLSFSKLSVTKGNVKSVGWNPSPKDMNVITTKLETDIKQKADKVVIEATKKEIDDLKTDFKESKASFAVESEKISSLVNQMKGDMVKKSEMEQTSDGFKRQIVEVTNEFKQTVENMELKHGEDSYIVNVISSRGNVFRNGIGATKLSATVFKGAVDITSRVPDELFKWSRISDNPSRDAEWNSKNMTGKKSIDVTDSDVDSQATFNCEIDIDEVEKILSGRV